ncbi:MAG: hypothetical protein H6835_05150 [Planctomycetes bacterium]|nr:hypothetical protein [Planctomycetota bacterium]
MQTLTQRPLRRASLALVLFATAACGGEAAEQTDWKNRELAWKYGPTTGAGSPTHLAATGTQGAPIAKGWKVHLVDGTKVTVHPFELSKQHELFGKCVMAVELYDKQSQKIETLVSTPITADGATFSFDVTEDIAKKTWDAIVWFRKV